MQVVRDVVPDFMIREAEIMHVHHLISFYKKAIRSDADSDKKLKLSLVNELLESSIKFDFGDIEQLPVTNIDPTIQRIPYDIFYCEISSGSLKVSCLFYSKNGVLEFGWVYIKARNSYTYKAIHFEVVNGIFCFPDDFDDAHLMPAKLAVSAAMEFIKIMNCSNVIEVNNHPSRLKKARAAKQGKQLFSWKTLHIKSSTKRYKNSAGGTHSSPRVHLRRGHIRTLASGKTTWVKRCVVGDKSQGMIGKDYKLELCQ